MTWYVYTTTYRQWSRYVVVGKISFCLCVIYCSSYFCRCFFTIIFFFIFGVVQTAATRSTLRCRLAVELKERLGSVLRCLTEAYVISENLGGLVAFGSADAVLETRYSSVSYFTYLFFQSTFEVGWVSETIQ